MKKGFYLLAALLFAAGYSATAAPGDTTWVQANNRRLDNGNGYGSYDTAVAFPSGATTYRKIYMIFTLGEYACPAGTQYCHQWDYTVTNYLLTPTDTLEISRLITPYANTGVPRFPSNWQKNYVFDVTDYASKLTGAAVSRIFYSGYSAGFTANVRFAFIEGTPERNVLGMSRLWSGSWQYGNAGNPIDNNVTVKNLSAPANTKAAVMKVTITGHGSDNNGCCEFASHNYAVKVNGSTSETKTIWRDNCGLNQLYPQGGTWIYDRANWCPGDLIYPIEHTLPGVNAGSAFTTDLDFDAYTAGNTSYGSYSLNGIVFYYGDLNRTLDASLVDIIAPTTADEHFRENPSGPSPIVRVRNTGSTPIVSIGFKYNVKDSAVAQYTWNGQLAALHDTIITLPALNTLTNMSLAGASGSYTFTTEIATVNGVPDNDATNNKMSSAFVVAPVWPADLVLTMKTNTAGTGGVGVGNSETSWVITDMNNNIVASRTNAARATLYADTIALRTGGYYKLTISDGGCDGLHWWVYDQNPQLGVTAGTFTVKRVGAATTIPMNGYTYTGTYANDFGCAFSQYFTTRGWATGIGNVHGTETSMQVYPNPATAQVAILVEGLANTAGQVELADMTGRTILSQAYAGGIGHIDISSMPAGIYQVIYRSSQDANVRLTQKLVVTK